jgi:hypothetical protein
LHRACFSDATEKNYRLSHHRLLVAARSPGIRVPNYSNLHPSKIRLQIYLRIYNIRNFFRKFLPYDFLNSKKIILHAENTITKER